MSQIKFSPFPPPYPFFPSLAPLRLSTDYVRSLWLTKRVPIPSKFQKKILNFKLSIFSVEVRLKITKADGKTLLLTMYLVACFKK
jgi:hypothetical protein